MQLKKKHFSYSITKQFLKNEKRIGTDKKEANLSFSQHKKPHTSTLSVIEIKPLRKTQV